MADDGYHKNGGDELPPFKRIREGEGPHVELRVLMRSSTSGAIIGKSGTNIKRLREQFKASVSIPDCHGPERILTISADLGTSLEILRDSLPRTAEDRAQEREGPGKGEMEVRILIHQSQAGGVIGKGGSRIKEIREATKANIKVFAACCPNSSDRVVLISGALDHVIDTVQQVWEIANEAGVKGATQPYDPNYFDEFLAPEYGGYGGAQGRDGGGGGGGGYGGRGDGMGMPPWGGPGGGMRGGMRGPPRGGMRGGGGGGMPPPPRGMPPPRGGMNRGGYDDNPRYRGNSGMDRMDRMDRGGHGLPDPTFAGQPNTANSTGEQTSQQVSIPKDLAGAIIGPQGTRVRAIRAQSGAQIIIGKSDPGATEDRVITINGTEEQIQNAQYLMQMAVRQHSGKF